MVKCEPYNLSLNSNEEKKTNKIKESKEWNENRYHWNIYLYTQFFFSFPSIYLCVHCTGEVSRFIAWYKAIKIHIHIYEENFYDNICSLFRCFRLHRVHCALYKHTFTFFVYPKYCDKTLTLFYYDFVLVFCLDM